ncbi:hypothetical protein SADUNF_Sadunf03G0039500 [Salix dunnii]|uniref:Ubiquitin-like protein ATG12 n=1 Tax=Salix dunnii TaxID=1413687 RepID=A0A835KB63_9ROSI|nr:hypothetical protein SADUNF_Sadunf03G0039500 [Salix dunnii]
MATDSLSSARKVIVQLKATADAPILKQNKFKNRRKCALWKNRIHGTDKFAKFVYINSAFSPNPDELVIDLFNLIFVLLIAAVIDNSDLKNNMISCKQAQQDHSGLRAKLPELITAYKEGSSSKQQVELDDRQGTCLII